MTAWISGGRLSIAQEPSGHRIFVSIGEPNHSVPTEPDPRGTMTFLNGKNIIDQAPAYSVIYIQSNLPCSVPLENGHSTQAPTGVYAVSFNGVIQAYK